MDLREPITIGDRIDGDFEQLVKAGGYDHNWVLNTKGDINQVAATVVAPTSGIQMQVYTNEPGLQIYCGNMMAEKENGKHGVVYPRRGAICLESQHYPDTTNHPDFPSAVLEPGQFPTVTEALKKIPEVVECHYTTGQYDLFIKIYAKNNQHLLSIIHNKLQPLGLARTESLISFKEAFKRQLPIDLSDDE